MSLSPEIEAKVRASFARQTMMETLGARLTELVAAADGLHATDDHASDARHLANTLFNVMRGGTFLCEGAIDASDFRAYLSEVAPLVAARHAERDFDSARTRDASGRRAGGG